MASRLMKLHTHGRLLPSFHTLSGPLSPVGSTHSAILLCIPAACRSAPSTQPHALKHTDFAIAIVASSHGENSSSLCCRCGCTHRSQCCCWIMAHRRGAPPLLASGVASVLEASMSLPTAGHAKRMYFRRSAAFTGLRAGSLQARVDGNDISYKIVLPGQPACKMKQNEPTASEGAIRQKEECLQEDWKVDDATEISTSVKSSNPACSVEVRKTDLEEHLCIESHGTNEELLVQGRKHSNVRVIVFDIETTGFKVSKDRIVEFAARDLAGGESSTIQALINPQRSVPFNVSAIHGIYTETVNKPSIPVWKDFARVLIKFVESRRMGTDPVILVAHNGKRFDVPFMVKEFQSCSLQIPTWWQFVDTLPLAREAMKMNGLKQISLKLSALYDYYGFPSVGKAHRATVDTHKLALVLQRVMSDLKMSPSSLLKMAFTAENINIQ